MTDLPPDDGYITAPYPGTLPQDDTGLLRSLIARVTPTRTGAAAVTWAATHRGPGWAGLCLKYVRSSFNVPSGYATAHDSYLSTTHRHPWTLTPPLGVPIWWSDNGPWHIAMSAGGGWCWSTDILRTGYADRVPVSLIQKAWGLTPVGWAEEVNAVRVWTPAPKPPPAPPAPVPPNAEESVDMLMFLSHHGPFAGRAIVIGLAPTPKVLPASVANVLSGVLKPKGQYLTDPLVVTAQFEADVAATFGVPTV